MSMHILVAILAVLAATGSADTSSWTTDGMLSGGTWFDTTFTAPSLGFPNQVRIYLPEGYDPQGSIDYPVIYWLHAWISNGVPGHSQSSAMTKTVLDSLIENGLIAPVLVVKPNGSCTPYWGSCWTNSILYGNYEDYVIFDLVDFVEDNFRVIEDPEFRCLAGHSMGGSGAMTLALKHPDRYRAVAAHSGYNDFQIGMGQVIPHVLEESPESSPPYSYDWDNGIYTKLLFLVSGAFSPNLSAPDSVDFLLDPDGFIIDSVWTLWESHNPAHMAKLLPLPLDLAIFTDCGVNDEWDGCYAANCAFSDTLTDLGIEHVFQSLPGITHGMNLDRFSQEFLFLNASMTNLEEDEGLPPMDLSCSVFPNPFATSTSIRFELPTSQSVRLDVYDLSGRLVHTLVEEVLPAGEHQSILDGTDFPQGVYLVRLETLSGSETVSCLKV